MKWMLLGWGGGEVEQFGGETSWNAATLRTKEEKEDNIKMDLIVCTGWEA